MLHEQPQSTGAGTGRAMVKKSTPMTTTLICQACQREAPSKFVEYHQNIGLLVIRFSQKYHGFLCKNCNRHYFWKATLITFFFGWWGVISFFMTIFFLIGNLASFVSTSSLPPAPPNAGRGELDEASSTRIAAQVDLITDRLGKGDDLCAIAQDVAQRANVTPGQAWRFIMTMLKHQNAPVAQRA